MRGRAGLAASNAQRTPSGTLRWLATFGRRGSAVDAKLSAFLKLLQQFQSPSDSGQIDAINRDVRKVNAALAPMVSAELAKLASALGLSS